MFILTVLRVTFIYFQYIYRFGIEIIVNDSNYLRKCPIIKKYAFIFFLTIDSCGPRCVEGPPSSPARQCKQLAASNSCQVHIYEVRLGS